MAYGFQKTQTVILSPGRVPSQWVLPNKNQSSDWNLEAMAMVHSLIFAELQNGDFPQFFVGLPEDIPIMIIIYISTLCWQTVKVDQRVPYDWNKDPAPATTGWVPACAGPRLLTLIATFERCKTPGRVSMIRRQSRRVSIEFVSLGYPLVI